jgi:surfeit locus 1 family protein
VTAYSFRPLPALSFASMVAFAALVSLGLWQLDRLQWKLDLIAEVDRNLAAPPLALAEALELGAAAQYRKVGVDGTFDNAKEAYLFTTGAGGGPVYHVIVPLRTTDGRTFLVDRGAVPKDKLDPATRRDGQLADIRHVVGVWRTPEKPGAFAPAPDMAHRIWYARDLAGIARADGVTLTAPVLIEADATPNPGGWPKGGQTVVAFRNEHLQYAITWFGLAAVLLGVYIAYHVARGRLGPRR